MSSVSAATAGENEIADTPHHSAASSNQRTRRGTVILKMRNTRDVVLSMAPLHLLACGIDFRDAVVVSNQRVAVRQPLSTHRIHQRHATGPNRLLPRRIDFDNLPCVHLHNQGVAA